MGVTAHFYAFNDNWFRSNYQRSINIDTLFDEGILDEEWRVTKEHSSGILEIDSFIGTNKQWYNNTRAEIVYDYIRRDLPLEFRKVSDQIYSLLFWNCFDKEIGCPGAVDAPLIDAEHRVYPASLISYILKNNPNLYQVKDKYDASIQSWSEQARRDLDLDCMDDFYTFEGWVSGWIDLFKKVQAIESKHDLSLYIYIWV